MLDTIVLTIADSYKITNHEIFSPSTKGLFEAPYVQFGQSFCYTCKFNQTSKDYEIHGYLPKIAVTKFKIANSYPVLRLEFSVPKILLGNNFYELENTDFDNVVTALQYKLHLLGITVCSKALKKASVSAIHYSKNILLDTGLQTSAITNELIKADVKNIIDITKTTFRNGGQNLTFHTNSYEIAFYDKCKEIEQAKTNEKYSIERYNSKNFPFLNDIFFIKHQVLRMEVRLGNKNTIARVFNKLNIDTNFTFEKLFKSSISETILSYFLKSITEQIDFLSVLPTYCDIYCDFIKNKDVTPTEALARIGSIALKKEGTNPRYIKAIAGKQRKAIKIINISTETLTSPTKVYMFKSIGFILKSYRTLQKMIMQRNE